MKKYILLGILVLGIPTVIFILIYILFYFQIGCPPGPELTASDWLAFLGSYLGSTGSLVMAYIVYKQDQKVNELTLREFDACVDFSIVNADCMIKDYSDDFHEKFTYTYDISLLKLDIWPKNTAYSLPERNSLFLHVAFINLGKFPITHIHFVEFNSTGSSSHENYCYSFESSKTGGNICNSAFTLMPNEKLEQFWFIHKPPQIKDAFSCDMKFEYQVGTAIQESACNFIMTISPQEDQCFQYRFLDGKKNPCIDVPRIT